MILYNQSKLGTRYIWTYNYNHIRVKQEIHVELKWSALHVPISL